MQKYSQTPLLQWIIRFLATGGFVGHLPKMPGTFGTVVGLGLALLTSTFFPPLIHMGFVVTFVFFSVLICTLYESHHDGHDRQEIVIDEIAGYLVASMWLPHSLLSWTLSFVLFRIFDMLKPFPISYLDEKVEGGLGVVADDIAAGLFTNFILQVFFRYYPQI